MPRHRYLFLDDGGVINDNAMRAPQWRALLGEFMASNLGRNPEEWGAANTSTFPDVYARQQKRLAGWHDGRDYLAEMRLTNVDWVMSMCLFLEMDLPSEEDCADIGERAQRRIMSRVAAGHPGAAEAVQELSKSYALYTASGGTSNELDLHLRTLNIEGLFRRLYGPDLVNWPKLGPEYYRRIFADADVKADDCIVVESDAGIIPWIREIGAFAVHVDTTLGKSDADLTIATLAELPAILREIDA